MRSEGALLSKRFAAVFKSEKGKAANVDREPKFPTDKDFGSFLCRKMFGNFWIFEAGWAHFWAQLGTARKGKNLALRLIFRDHSLRNLQLNMLQDQWTLVDPKLVAA